MPSFEGRKFGTEEKEWGQNMEKDQDYQEQWKEAEAQLRMFLIDFNANTSLIPLEDYDSYLEVARLYKAIADKYPHDIDKKLLIVANAIINESPVESAA